MTKTLKLMSHISAWLGALCLLAVLCFHFPQLLTSQILRPVYGEAFARTLLQIGLIAALLTGAVGLASGQTRNLARLGLATTVAAVALGGAGVALGKFAETPYSLSLDWCILGLLFSALIFIPIEQLLAVRRVSPLRPEWRTDLAYFMFTNLTVQVMLVGAAMAGGMVASFIAIPGLAWAVAGLPFILQVLLAAFIADLMQSSFHRAGHKLPLLWRFHAVHHSARHMDWLAAGREHPGEILSIKIALMLPLLIVGFSPAVITAYFAFAGVQAILNHANLRLNLGWLEYVVTTPRYHHWHHARREDYVDANYALHFPVIDMLMGTFKRPPAGQWPQDYGVLDPSSVPDGFIAQTAAPFWAGATKTRQNAL